MCDTFIVMNLLFPVLSSLSLVILVTYGSMAHAQLQLTDHPFITEKLILEPMPLTRKSHVIKKNSSVHESLTGIGLSSKDVYDIVEATKESYDLSNIPSQTVFEVARLPDGNIANITFILGTLQKLRVSFSHQAWASEFIQIPTTTQVVQYSGYVKDSFWSSGAEANLPPYLIVSFAEVFAWQVDFSREVRNGDRWQFSIEQIMAEGKPVGWGNILFAEYVNQGESYKAYYYENEEADVAGHFDEKGESLRKVFLKSPLKFGRISSRFTRKRFHPVQKRYKPHLGVDYAAPTGTPIRVVGDGRITKIGRYGGAGKMIVVKHVSSYTTKYLHMSRFAPGLRVGSKVRQSQVIGYVGTTGLSTGPHLHFELHELGRVVDPLRVNLPSSDPIPKTLLPSYFTFVQQMDRKLASVDISKELEQNPEVVKEEL